MRLIQALILGAAVAASGVHARANDGLASERDINDGLLVIAAADKIRRACDSIGGRLITARSYATQLKNLAMERGYSEREIEAYINDKAEKAKMREKRNAYFASKGASNLDPESLCVLGRDEIARGTRIGQLLRAK
ncbi:DUF5333 domain-containing protein [Roseovarius aestuariivivens]|uniref:DUF5333 domain-containing protein n=1 Tax=Roseovarius aestuariivivens TaxID=1888910 RepID=UPI00108035E3|nr:DUF5333 domain-containing protein [Roseovarius aestuariivivens]